MKKNDYIEMLIAENTDEKKKKLYSDVIDCVDIALSQEPDSFKIKDSSIGLPELFGMIESAARNGKCNCVGPFEAAEMFAAKFGAKYVRASRRGIAINPIAIVKLEDFF